MKLKKSLLQMLAHILWLDSGLKWNTLKLKYNWHNDVIETVIFNSQIFLIQFNKVFA